MFLLYAGLNGVMFSVIFFIYARDTIAGAFVASAATFGAMSLYGFVTQRDLTRLGSFLFMGLIGVVLEHNGEVVATAAGAAALGHPAAAVAWLVRSLASENEGLRAGDIVLSGGLTAAVPVRAGDVVTATADRLGSIELGCT